MAWDFETDPEFQAKLDWMDTFVREQVEPLDYAFREAGAPYDRKNPMYKKVTDPLKAEVKRQGLWACHLGPELGGLGYGQLKLALMNEILGRSVWAPTIFGCQAPDSGNAEILAALRHAGAEEEVPRAAARRRHRLVLLDDRAAGRRRSARVQVPRRARRRRLGHQRREVLLLQRQPRRVSDHHGRSPTPTCRCTRAPRCSSSRATTRA